MNENILLELYDYCHEKYSEKEMAELLYKFGNEINDRLVSYFKDNKKIIFYYSYSGGVWDYDVGVIVKNSEELREFINEFRNVFSDFVKILDVSTILKEITGYKLPKGVLNN